MLAADARAGAVVVRTLPADQVLGIGRPSLGQRAPVAAPGPTGGALRVECGNTVYPPSFDGARAVGRLSQRPDPAQRHVPARAWAATRCAATPPRPTGRCRRPSPPSSATPICITDSYRTYASQVRLYGQKPALAAVPGTSNHGWGLAVDLCGGIETLRHARSTRGWSPTPAGSGSCTPTWADPGNGREEPWHWEYAGT